MLHLASEVGFVKILAGCWSLKMETKTWEELSRDQLWEELHIWNQPVDGSKEQLQQHLPSCQKKEGLDSAVEIFEVKDAKSTPELLMQILEKLSAIEYHLANLTARVNQQQEHLTAIVPRQTSNMLR